MLFARRGAICSAVNRRLKFRVGGSEVSQKHKFVTGSPKTDS